jgi:flagellar basal-body rod modification protein FlgD
MPALPITSTNGAFSSTSAAAAAAARTTSGGAVGGSNETAAEGSDRFLKLLVAQLQNQDPLNPLDNAQVTSQLAQIQTVNGIEKLNTSVLGLNAQFAQLQALGGAALVGRNVLIEGSRLDAGDGIGHGGFEIASQADRVQLEVLDGGGHVIDSTELGAAASGRHSFDWTPQPGVDATRAASFRITAALGTNAVAATTLARDRVDAVSAGPGGLTLELQRAGPVAYERVKLFD